MSRLSSIAFSIGLLGSGALAWTVGGRPLLHNPELDAPLNPLGINRSPYGEVFAMAMQGPIESYYHEGMGGEHHHDHEAPEALPAVTPLQPKRSLNARFETMLTSLDQVAEERTNPKAASEALKRHLRRQAEDKLRFAYCLDPSHYGNYNTLHFFLTEPQVGTHPELTPSATKLADDTIRYCLQQDDDPRPALTAAAACTNVLLLMFDDHHSATPKYQTAQMRPYLERLDQCLARYASIAQLWDQSKHWDLLSPQRIAECQDRFTFITKIRDAADQTILRFEQQFRSPQASRLFPLKSQIPNPKSDI